MKVKQLVFHQKQDIWDKRNANLNEFLNKKLIIRTNNYIHLIDIKKISFIQASSNYSKINIIDEKSIISSKTLKHFEEKLINNGFLRIHSSYLVNSVFISGIAKNGIWTIVLQDNTKLPISRSYKERLFNILRII